MATRMINAFCNLQPKNELGLCEISLHTVMNTLPKFSTLKIYEMKISRLEFFKCFSLAWIPFDKSIHSINVYPFVRIHVKHLIADVQYFTTCSWLGCDFNANKKWTFWILLWHDQRWHIFGQFVIMRFSIHCRVLCIHRYILLHLIHICEIV